MEMSKEQDDTIRMHAIGGCGYVVAKPGQCIYLTHPRDRWAPVAAEGLAGTVTCRPGELGIYLGRRDNNE